MSAQAGWLSLLVPDERGQRVVQETMADWRADAAQAETTTKRVRAHALGVVSVIRLSAGLLADQLRWPRLWRTGLATLVGALIAGLTLAGWLTWSGGITIPGVTPAAYLLMWTGSFSGSLFALLSALGLGETDDRPSPVIGTFSVLFFLSWALTHWVAAALTVPIIQQMPPRFGSSMRYVPVAPLVEIASLSFASSYYLLGTTIRRRMKRFRRASALAAVLIISAMGVAVRAWLFPQPVVPYGPYTAIVRELVMCAQLAIAWTAIIWLSRKLKPATSES